MLSVFKSDIEGGSFRKFLLNCTTLFALSSVAVAGQALAQSETPAPAARQGANEAEVIIVGIRKGIQDAISAKLTASSIVEVISAEDIGKLPDQSIAESIARLPGIAAQRDKGRAQTLSIRGLGPDYSVTTFNGREQASTNDNRTVEFDQYPSDIVAQVKVYKTPDAGMTYQGLAGTADIQTIRPLSLPGRTIALGAKYEMNGKKAQVNTFENTGQRFSATYVDQFLDRTLGVALAYSHATTPYQAVTNEPWGYPDCGSQCRPADASNKIFGGDKSGYQSSEFKRDAIMGVVEWKPNDRIAIVGDAYHSDFKELQTIRRLEYGTTWGAGQLQPGYTVTGNRITAGQFNNIWTVVENYATEREASIDNWGLNAKFTPTDKWTFEADLSNSQVERTDVTVESTAGTGPNQTGARDTLRFTTNGDGVTLLTNALNYGDYTRIFLTDPGGWGSALNRQGYVKRPTVKDEINALRLSAKRGLDAMFISDVSVGVNYAERRKSKDWFQAELRGRTAAAEIVPVQFRRGVSSTSLWNNPNGIISYDALGMFRSGYWNVTDARVDPNANSGDRTFSVTNTWTVRERLTTLFVKFDVDTEIFGRPLTGNFGVQNVRAEQRTVQGYTDGTTAPGNPALLNVQRVGDGATYSDTLPSMNLAYKLADSTLLRFAAAKTIARPRMDNLAGGASYNAIANSVAPPTSNGVAYYWNASGGNPRLEPWRATSYDLSLEHYFGKKGYVSLAGYYKDLETYIFNKSVPVNFSGFPVPTPAANYTLAAANRRGFSSSPANGEGGWINGVEFTASVPFDLAFESLDGFGLVFSYARNNSKITPDGTNSVPLPGLSPEVINTTLYFEKYGFSARISQRNRSEFIGEVPNFDGSLATGNFVGSEKVLDAQIGYTFGGGLLEGLSLNVSATNLTDQPFRFYQGEGNSQQPLKYEKYGPTYLFSVGYKFR